MFGLVLLCSPVAASTAQTQDQPVGVDASLPEVPLLPWASVIIDSDNSLTPDAIIADYRLTGDATGSQVVESIRKLLKQQIPALIITGETQAETLQTIEGAGLPLLHKPVVPAKLMLFLRQCRKNT